MSDDRLRLYVERIERLYEERKGITDDIRDVFSEAKGDGYSASTLRKLIQRRGMEPHKREEADIELALYEEAIGITASGPSVPLTERRPDAAALALELLTAEIVSLEDASQAAALVEHVIFLLDLRAEIAVLRAQEAARRKLAKDEGFEVKQLQLVVRWYEKVAKHGLEAMQAGEALFGIYRGTFDTHQARSGMTTERDRALMDKFAGENPAEKKATARRKRVNSALLLARAVNIDGKGKRSGQ